MEDFFDVIGLDLGSGNRDVDLKKENKKILDKDFKNPKTLEDLKAIYGETLPTNLPVLESIFASIPVGNTGVNPAPPPNWDNAASGVISKYFAYSLVVVILLGSGNSSLSLTRLLLPIFPVSIPLRETVCFDI